MSAPVLLYAGEALGKYGFPDGHPLGIDRQGAFLAAAARAGLDRRVRLLPPRAATAQELARFHTGEHVRWVEECSRRGDGYIDYGDTPAFPGVFEAGATLAGTALDAVERVMAGDALRTFQPIGGLHHAHRERAGGFCVFNDIGVAIETLRARHGITRIGYVDIDVHHGDGVFYPYEHDPDLIIADVHEDGSFLYPGTGHAFETGRGGAQGTKLNIPLAPGAGDREFLSAWERVVAHLARHRPQIILFQCGADGLAGDPLADLRYSPAAHARAAADLCRLADEFCAGRLICFGGGGYDLANLAAAWTAVLGVLAKA
ncbi:MAG: hypothetical protein N2544_14760 [Burkholderiales bacterium]|nr:hypothetical protein [Burkholderiales bacterium]